MIICRGARKFRMIKSKFGGKWGVTIADDAHLFSTCAEPPEKIEIKQGEFDDNYGLVLTYQGSFDMNALDVAVKDVTDENGDITQKAKDAALTKILSLYTGERYKV